MGTAGKHRKHKYRHMAALLYGVPLAITAEKLGQIVEIFEFRRAGGRLTQEEIELRIGAFIDPEEPDDDDEADRKPYALTPQGVAILPIHGVLSRRVDWMDAISGGISSEAVAAAVDQAAADPEVRAIVLDIDSPGGSVSGTAEAADRVFAVRGKKPICAVANGQMCSAAYWIGSAADSVVTTASSTVGSIGVIGVHSERSAASEKSGVKYSVISAGKHKADANQYEPLSKQGRETLQERIDDAYVSFVGAVARNRATTVDAVIEGYGQGKAFDGQKAVETKLADRVATLNQIVSELGAQVSAQPVAGARMSPAGGRYLASAPPDETGRASTPLAASSTSAKEFSTMSAKLKAALFARGLIASLDASDEIATASLNAFFAGRGSDKPADEAAQLAALVGTAERNIIGTARLEETKSASTAGEVERAKTEGARAERERIDQIRARGKLLGADEKAIAAAIDGGDSLGTALENFTAEKAKVEQPVTPLPAGSEVDKFAAAALEAISERFMPNPVDAKGRPLMKVEGREIKPLSAAARELRYTRLPDIARVALRQAGVECRGMDDEDIAAAWLVQGLPANGRKETFRLGAFDGSSYQTPSDFPNILSALAGKMMDLALETNTSTFRSWCAPMPSVPDFKPKTIIAVGGFGELPEWVDGDTPAQSKRSEEASFIQADRFGDEAKLTPVMIANDDLGVFNETLTDKVIAHELTLNRLCVNLLLGNVTCADGNTLFGATHANRITAGSGGAPSVAQTKAMRALFRAQTDVGAARKMRVPPAIALFGSNWETDAEQVYTLPPDGVFYSSDTSINTFRRSITPILEQQIDDGTSLLPWYLLGDPRRVRAIVYCFQTGFEGGKVQVYYDPSRGCRIYQIEGRFAAAVRNWRGIVRNSGGDGAF